MYRFWMIDVELEAEAGVEDFAHHAARICNRNQLGDPEGANVFHVAADGSQAQHLLQHAREQAVRIDLGEEDDSAPGSEREVDVLNTEHLLEADKVAYRACSCDHSPEIAIGPAGVVCGDCEEAGCEPGECQREDEIFEELFP